MSYSLGRITGDIYHATHGKLFKPDYKELMINLEVLKGKDQILPRIYQTNVLHKFIDYLNGTKDSFEKIFNEDEHLLNTVERDQKRLVEEVAEALLQLAHAFRYDHALLKDLKAFQAVVSTIYVDVLSLKISQLANCALPPLVKCINKNSPNTFSQAKTAPIGIKAGIVGMPTYSRTGGIVSWASIGHEVAGHNFLHAFEDGASGKSLITEISSKINESLNQSDTARQLADYWSACIEEITSDVLGVLNMGPSFGLALLAYFRGVRGGKLESTGVFYSTESKSGKNSVILDNPKNNQQTFVETIGNDIRFKNKEGVFGFLEPSRESPLFYKKFDSADKHPLDVLRLFVVAKVIKLIDAKSNITKFIREEASKDTDQKKITLLMLVNSETTGHKTLEPVVIDLESARKTSNLVAKTILDLELERLQNKSIRTIINWTPEDEKFVKEIMDKIAAFPLKPLRPVIKFSARHIVASAILKSLEKNADIGLIFENMKTLLVQAYESLPPGYFGQHLKL
jgi:hypothetical protein